MDNHESWHIAQLPFIWKPLPRPDNQHGLPNTLPFTLSADERTGTFIQVSNSLVSNALARAYSIGSAISGQMDAAGIGRGYAEDFLKFMTDARSLSEFRQLRILEVGCGNGYLLHRLAQMGAEVLGIDPGEHRSATFGVPIIRDFFPSSRIDGRFDIIIVFAMLEHVEDPFAFIDQLLSFLNPSGELFVGVPDCGPFLDAGDISCLFHEHWSYYDEDTLAGTLGLATGRDVHVRVAGFGGMLYARVGGERFAYGHRAISPPRRTVATFRGHAERGIASVTGYIDDAARRGETVGVYVPGRIVNALFAGGTPAANCRFIDDNPLLTGTYYPGIDIVIEDRASLIARPPDRILIMSRSFGTQIAAELQKSLPASITMTSWAEIFSDSPTDRAGST
jgi:SAM-dependent methyltransferase